MMLQLKQVLCTDKWHYQVLVHLEVWLHIFLLINLFLTGKRNGESMMKAYENA